MKRENHICTGYTRQSCNLPSLFLFKERNENKWMLNTCTKSQRCSPILRYKHWKELHKVGSGCLFVSLLENPSPFYSVYIAYWQCAQCRWINSLSHLITVLRRKWAKNKQMDRQTDRGSGGERKTCDGEEKPVNSVSLYGL